MLRSLRKKLSSSNHILSERDNDDNDNDNDNDRIETSRKSTVETMKATFPNATPKSESNNTRDPFSRSFAEKKQRLKENRSVNDFQSKEDLKQALLSNTCIKESGNAQELQEPAWLFSKNQHDLQDLMSTKEDDLQVATKDVDPKLDWVLENYDEATTEKQSLSHELRRLLVLKSYLVLDIERKDSFEQLTALASKHFDCPICRISMVDLGRQWFLSIRGVDDTHETPRKLAFCAHAIASTKDCFVVSDATKDPRFQDNPRVTGPPGIRFYAGAPLVSPEGYKLGTLCVIDTKPRGFSLDDEQCLIALSKMAVQTLVAHRRKMSGWFNDLVRTHFPEFEVNDAGDNDLSAASLGSENDDDREFAVFLETSKHMSLESLLSLLQSQARADNLAPESFQPYGDKTFAKPLVKHMSLENLASLLQSQERAQNLAPESFQPYVALPEHDETLAKPLVKRFRFQECGENGQVSTQVNIVDSWKHMEELWWSPEELQATKTEAFNTAQHFRTHRPDYIQCVQIVAKGAGSQTEIEDAMRLLMKESNARGLESLIVNLLRDARKIAVKAVLLEQDKCNDNLEMQSQRLRESSMLYTHISMRFAEKMGQCDQIDALKASTSNKKPVSVRKKMLKRFNSAPL
jgi:GAF domain-containing protein